MPYQIQTVANEAVFFFSPTNVMKEMLFSEFEAVLDGIVEMPELASQDWKAVFIQTNAQLDVLACVFFFIKFDENGAPDRTWNMPLRHMAEIAGVGPDMGAGPIRLSCRSQCPVPWHQSRSWDPSIQPEDNSFVAIRDALVDNRLAFVIEEIEGVNEDDVPVLMPIAPTDIYSEVADQYSSPANNVATPITAPQAARDSVVDPSFFKKEVAEPVADNVNESSQPPQYVPNDTEFDRSHRDKAAKLIKKLRFQISTQETKRQDEVVALHTEYGKDIASLNQQIEQLRLGLSLEQKKNLELKEHLSEQAAEFELAREQFVDQVEDSKQLEAKQLEGLKKKYALELKAKLEQELSGMKETLDTREVELLYREEQIASLRQEVAALHDEKQDLLKQGGNNILERVAKTGVTFVAFHPGVGHITILFDQMGRYLESPTAFVAEKAFVTEDHYLEWLKHYHNSVCTHCDSKGEPCLTPVKKIDRPAEFVIGRSDRCELHQSISLEAASAVLKIS